MAQENTRKKRLIVTHNKHSPINTYYNITVGYKSFANLCAIFKKLLPAN